MLGLEKEDVRAAVIVVLLTMVVLMSTKMIIETMRSGRAQRSAESAALLVNQQTLMTRFGLKYAQPKYSSQ